MKKKQFFTFLPIFFCILSFAHSWNPEILLAPILAVFVLSFFYLFSNILFSYWKNSYKKLYSEFNHLTNLKKSRLNLTISYYEFLKNSSNTNYQIDTFINEFRSVVLTISEIEDSFYYNICTRRFFIATIVEIAFETIIAIRYHVIDLLVSNKLFLEFMINDKDMPRFLADEQWNIIKDKIGKEYFNNNQFFVSVPNINSKTSWFTANKFDPNVSNSFHTTTMKYVSEDDEAKTSPDLYAEAEVDEWIKGYSPSFGAVDKKE
jgi:hypothetical protein